VDFYNARLATVNRYDVEARTPADAIVAGRLSLRAGRPSVAGRRRPSLFQQAECIGGQDGSGWVLYRIVKRRD
jgi:hypothetical protein